MFVQKESTTVYVRLCQCIDYWDIYRFHTLAYLLNIDYIIMWARWRRACGVCAHIVYCVFCMLLCVGAGTTGRFGLCTCRCCCEVFTCTPGGDQASFSGQNQWNLQHTTAGLQLAVKSMQLMHFKQQCHCLKLTWPPLAFYCVLAALRKALVCSVFITCSFLSTACIIQW